MANKPQKPNGCHNCHWLEVRGRTPTGRLKYMAHRCTWPMPEIALPYSLRYFADEIAKIDRRKQGIWPTEDGEGQDCATWRGEESDHV